MIKISVKSELAQQISLWTRIAGDQMPFATAVALTRSAKNGKTEIERKMPSVIDRPTPYTMRGFRLYPATKRKLYAEVDFRESLSSGTQARDYLAPIVYGGSRKLKAFEKSLSRTGLLPSGYSAVPGSGAKMDRYGNMNRGQIVQVLSYLKSFGEQGYSANITDKKRASLARGSKARRGVTYFVGKPGGGRLPLGVWMRTSFGAAGSSIKPLIIFVSNVGYRQQLDVPGIAERVVRETFPEELRKAVELALRTARPK